LPAETNHGLAAANGDVGCRRGHISARQDAAGVRGGGASAASTACRPLVGLLQSKLERVPMAGRLALVARADADQARRAPAIPIWAAPSA